MLAAQGRRRSARRHGIRPAYVTSKIITLYACTTPPAAAGGCPESLDAYCLNAELS